MGEELVLSVAMQVMSLLYAVKSYSKCLFKLLILCLYLATRDNDFICLNSGTAVHRVKEFQFCDRNQDCINGSDEPESCAKGICNIVCSRVIKCVDFSRMSSTR